MMRKLWRGLPSTVAAAAAIGAMMLVRREWTAQVGLFVYFSVLVLLTDGIDIFDRERFERLIIWKK
ncbi:MAG: hypothetical protein WAL02_01215 [Rhodoplanes sp.]|jgi:hypothetical protein